MASSTPSSSAWNAAAPTTSTSLPTPPASEGDKAKVELLDTFEPSKTKTLSSSNAEKVAPLSEDEQLKKAMEDSEIWQTVEDKRSKKKLKAPQPAAQLAPQIQSENQKENKKEDVKEVAIKAPKAVPQVKREPEVQDVEWDVAGYSS